MHPRRAALRLLEIPLVFLCRSALLPGRLSTLADDLFSLEPLPASAPSFCAQAVQNDTVINACRYNQPAKNAKNASSRRWTTGRSRHIGRFSSFAWLRSCKNRLRAPRESVWSSIIALISRL